MEYEAWLESMPIVPLLADQFVQDFIQTAGQPGLGSAGAHRLKYLSSFTHGLPVKLNAYISQLVVFTIHLDLRPDRLEGTKRLPDRHGIIAQYNRGKPDRGRLDCRGIEVIALTNHFGGTVGLPFGLYSQGAGQEPGAEQRFQQPASGCVKNR